MIQEEEKQKPFDRLKAAVESGDANAVLSIAADEKLSGDDLKKIVADTLDVMAEKYKKAAGLVKPYVVQGIDRQGRQIILTGGNSFEIRRAIALTELAERLRNS